MTFMMTPPWVLAGLTKPQDGSELNFIHVLFEWDEVNNATGYEFQLSSTNDFASSLVSTGTTNLYYVEKDVINWESQYFWRVRAINGDWMSEYTFHTNNQSYIFTDVDPVDIITNNSSALEGITIYGVMNPFYSAAIDMDGNEVWNSGGVDSYMFSYVDNNHIFLGDANLPPNYKGELGVEFNIEQGITWSQPTYGDTIDFLQHELIKLPNGNYMGFVVIYKDHFVPNSDDFSNIPSDVDFSFENNIPGWGDGTIAYPWIWKGERIVEWDTDGNEIWSWDPFDENYGFNLDDFDYISEFWENVASSGDPFDWTHFNALSYDETENSVYVSSKNLSRITKINRATGEIIWNVGKQWLGDDIVTPDNKFSGQHGLQLLDNGNLVFFDNGILSGKFDGTNIYKSTVIELRVNENLDGEYSAETIWSYTLPTELYGVISGNVQKLSNENYLITTVGSADGAHSLEVTQSGETVWDCKYNVGTPQGAIYRAMRIPGLYENEFVNLDSNMNLSNNVTPYNFSINSIYPNPFNPIINIEYELSVPAAIQIEIYNIKGQQIYKINEGYKFPGIYSAVWNGENYPSGMYVITLEIEPTLLTKKMILLK